MLERWEWGEEGEVSNVIVTDMPGLRRKQRHEWKQRMKSVL